MIHAAPRALRSVRAQVSLAAVLAALLTVAALAAGCGGEPPAPAGRGLVVLPYDGPLARGVTERDPRASFHDFGRVTDGDTVSRVFQLRNEDPVDVSITDVSPGCGCTIATLRAIRADGSVERGLSATSKADKLLTVAPGEIAELEVRVATRDLQTKNDHKLIVVRVTTDSPNGHYMTFEVHVIAEQAFSVVPGRLALGDVPESGGKDAKVEIIAARQFGAHRVTEVLPPPPGITAELTSEERLGLEVWTLRASVAPPLARGPLDAVLHLSTVDETGAPGREIEVPLTGMVVGDLATSPARLVFAAPRATAQETSVELFSLLAGHRLRVTAVEVPEEHRAFLSARAEPVEPDDGGSSLRWRVTLATAPPLPEENVITGTLTVALDDPQHPSYSLEYVVHVR